LEKDRFYQKKNIQIFYKGSSVFVEKKISDEDLNTIGTVHGGIIATLIDTAGCFVFKEKINTFSINTINLNITFIKSINEVGEKITAVGKIIKSGGNIGISEVNLLKGKVICAKAIVQVYFKKIKAST